MDNESEVIRLLTEIRDNQLRQIEANQKSQQDYKELYQAAWAQQQRRAIVAAIVVGIGIAMVMWAVLSR